MTIVCIRHVQYSIWPVNAFRESISSHPALLFLIYQKQALSHSAEKALASPLGTWQALSLIHI